MTKMEKPSAFSRRNLLKGAGALVVSIGTPVGIDLMLSARRFDAEEAVRLGVISRMCPHDDLREAALAAAREVLQTAPDARVLTKRMLHDRYEPIDYQTMFWALEHSPEPREGMTAFMEKRRPNWIPDDV